MNIKYLTVLLLLTNFIICKSQTIIVRGGNNGSLPSNFLSTGSYYYKDVHNYLDNYVGTWEYVNGNEKFQILMTKILKYHIFHSDIKLNFYEDRISIKYKKFVNNTLMFESPSNSDITFISDDGLKLKGSMTDYGRVTVDANYWPTPLLPSGVFKHGGEYFHPRCTIEKIPQSSPAKIKFNLSLRQSSGFGNEYNNPAYAGQPTFSIPNNVVMTKVP